MVKLDKIYPRTGDAGKTRLSTGEPVEKWNPRVIAYGSVDEVNAALGVAVLHAADDMAARLRRIQNDLFDLGADIATPAGDDDDFAPSEMVLRIVAGQTAWLEQAIDEANTRLEPLTSFVLPGGSEGAARLHVARAAARRAERAMTAMAAQHLTNRHALAYINRLSDYLFVLARVANDDGRADVKWVPGANR